MKRTLESHGPNQQAQKGEQQKTVPIFTCDGTTATAGLDLPRPTPSCPSYSCSAGQSHYETCTVHDWMSVRHRHVRRVDDHASSACMTSSASASYPVRRSRAGISEDEVSGTIEHKNYVALGICLILGNLTEKFLGMSVSFYQVIRVDIVEST